MKPRTRNGRNDASSGYALLAMIIALMVMAIWMTVAIPDARIQAQREDEIDFYYAGDQMAEAIARYYNGGKLSPMGLNFVGQRMPYGPLMELKKLRDGVAVGTKTVRFVRASAFVDPLTDEEWEPIRIGDPRIRKFLLAWSRATGRPIPPTYTQLIGVQSATDDEELDEDFPASGDEPGDGTGATPPGGVEEEEEDEDEDEWEDEADEEDEGWDEEEDEEEDGDEGASSGRRGAGSVFVRASFFAQNTNSGPFGGNSNVNGNTNGRPGGLGRPAFGRDRRNNPIIGVVSRSRARAVKTRYGLERHNQMLFIYMPPPPRVQVVNPQRPGGTGHGGSGVDANNDGIDDSVQKPSNSNVNATRP